MLQHTVLQTDASDAWIASVLCQQDEDGTDRPVALNSRKLLLWERKYATIEKDCLAVVEKVKQSRIYFTWIPFTTNRTQLPAIPGENKGKKMDV